MVKETVLLTGATGFIGFAVLRALLGHGYKVHAAVRSEEKADIVRCNPCQEFAEGQLDFVIIPDLVAEGAFDHAVKGVKYIVHVASPLPKPETTGGDDLDVEIIQPAIRGTAGIFKSAKKSGTVKRIVVTSSATALIPMSAMANGTNDIFGPDCRLEADTAPYMRNTQVAYATSKILALKYAEDFIANEKPAFDAIHIHPSIVLGRDELALTVESIDRGSNMYGLGPVLGRHTATPFPMIVVHIEDVALAHVRSLDSNVAGNQSFMLSNTGDEGYSWDDSKLYAQEHFSEAVERFNIPNDGLCADVVIKCDIEKTEKQLGIKMKSFEEMIVSLVGQYVELAESQGTVVDK